MWTCAGVSGAAENSRRFDVRKHLGIRRFRGAFVPIGGNSEGGRDAAMYYKITSKGALTGLQ